MDGWMGRLCKDYMNRVIACGEIVRGPERGGLFVRDLPGTDGEGTVRWSVTGARITDSLTAGVE